MVLIAILLAYLVGSFPTGFLIVLWRRGFDVRTIGSRRTGATNVIRAAGWGWGVFVFIADMAKGAAGVWLARWLVGTAWPASPDWAWGDGRALLVGLCGGLAAILGHNWPLYLKFRGGRGVAATLGSVLAVAPLAAVGAFLTAVLVVALTRWVSLGSMVGTNVLSLGLLAYGALTPMPYWPALYGVVVGLLVIARHKDNIERLLAGTERKLGERVDRGPA